MNDKCEDITMYVCVCVCSLSPSTSGGAATVAGAGLSCWRGHQDHGQEKSVGQGETVSGRERDFLNVNHDWN